MRSAELFPRQQRDDPNLQVVAEDDAGVTVSGMKMLATSAVYADEILIGNLTPIDDKLKSEASPPRCRSTHPAFRCGRASPMRSTSRTRPTIRCLTASTRPTACWSATDVKIPWERVFLHNDANMSRRIYIETPANCYQNHQSNIRFWSKMGLIVGLASRVCQANGIDKIPAVRETLGRLAALEATIGGLVQGQIEAWEEWPEGFATPNRRIMYAALNWCQEHHTEIIDTLRTLLGGFPLVMPASIDVLTDDALRDRFERWWKTPSIEAIERYKLYKLAWDIVGSEFAGRHMLYEKFYAGNSIVVRNQSDREAPWERFHAMVDGLLAGIEVPSVKRFSEKIMLKQATRQFGMTIRRKSYPGLAFAGRCGARLLLRLAVAVACRVPDPAGRAELSILLCRSRSRHRQAPDLKNDHRPISLCRRMRELRGAYWDGSRRNVMETPSS